MIYMTFNLPPPGICQTPLDMIQTLSDTHRPQVGYISQKYTLDKYMYFLSLPCEIGGDLRDDGVDLLDDGVDLLSNAGRSSLTTITHIALLLCFEIGI